MTKYVISTQRSGLNWVRFNIEYHLNLKTPGKPLLISPEKQTQNCFVRKHDPMRIIHVRSFKKRIRNALIPSERRKHRTLRQYPRINPRELNIEDILILLVRDPREIFVRSALKRYSRFGIYLANLRFFCQANTDKKRVFYYEDLVQYPKKMFELINFLDLDEYSDLNEDIVAETWEEKREQSFYLYKNAQKHSGGPKTKKNPFNFKFHQSKLSITEQCKLEQHIRSSLTSDEFALIERYFV